MSVVLLFLQLVFLRCLDLTRHADQTRHGHVRRVFRGHVHQMKRLPEWQSFYPMAFYEWDGYSLRCNISIDLSKKGFKIVSNPKIKFAFTTHLPEKALKNSYVANQPLYQKAGFTHTLHYG